MTEDNKPNPAPLSVAVDEEEIKDSDIDQALAEEDPTFIQSLGEIGKDQSLTETQGDTIVEQESAAERIKFRINLTARIWRERLKESPKLILGGIKNFFKKRLEAFSEWQRSFRYYSWKKKLAFFGIVFMMCGTGFFIYKSLTHGILHDKDELFIRSLETLASDAEEYDPQTETEPFYDNLRTSSNILLIPKMVVNIKKSAQSGSNPMGAFEFYLEGMIPEAIVEIKDREIEIRDLMQRVTEGFSFDQLDTAQGKNLLCERLQKEINPILTTGKLKRVWIKTIILKP